MMLLLCYPMNVIARKEILMTENANVKNRLNIIDEYKQRNLRIRNITDALSSIRLTLMLKKLVSNKIRVSDFRAVIKNEVNRIKDELVKIEIDNVFSEFYLLNNETAKDDSGNSKGAAFTKRDRYHNSSNSQDV